jgi:ABC-2 type transport system ATP-binding protein
MGHNGAGKTTLINVMGGLISFDDGNMRLYDQTLNADIDKIRKKLGIVS